MKNLLRASLALLAVAGVLLALTAYRHARATEQKTQTVFVNFEGPWAFARDPNDANSVFAFAPKTKTHHDLVVETGLAPSQTRQAASLPAGIYEFTLPAIPSSTPNRTPSIDPNVLQAKIDAQGVQHALSAKSERYAIRLPRPEAYVSHFQGKEPRRFRVSSRRFDREGLRHRSVPALQRGQAQRVFPGR